MQQRSSWWKRPSNVTSGSVHSSRMSVICSSRRAPRVAKSMPRASYSTQFQPVPTPMRSRSCESRSASAACCASQHRLPLRQDHDARRELDARGDRREVAEGDERVVEGVVLRVRAPQRGLPVGMLGSHDVVVEQQAVVAERLDREADLVHARRVAVQSRSAGRRRRASCLGAPRVRDATVAARLDAGLPHAPLRDAPRAVDARPSGRGTRPTGPCPASTGRRSGARRARSSRRSRCRRR